MNINLTLIGQSITFFIFVWFCLKFVWPPIMGALEERKKQIADGLAAAERGAHEKELAEKKATKRLHEAKGQAQDILAQAQKRSNEIIDEAKVTAKAEGDRLVIAAQAEIEQEVNRMKEQMREQVVAIAIQGAEKILKREVDQAAHNDALKELASQI
jgi:F-type H+-transporting ATPase subunit b